MKHVHSQQLTGLIDTAKGRTFAPKLTEFDDCNLSVVLILPALGCTLALT